MLLILSSLRHVGRQQTKGMHQSFLGSRVFAVLILKLVDQEAEVVLKVR
jgi:hypothetical protein